MSRVPSWASNENNLKGLVKDLEEAIRLAYSLRIAAARGLQQMLMTFAFALRDKMPAEIVRGLMEVYHDFGVDMAEILMKLHFDGTFRSQWLEKQSEQDIILKRGRVQGWSCEYCKKSIDFLGKRSADEIILDPIDFGGQAWCCICGPRELSRKLNFFASKLTWRKTDGEGQDGHD